VIALMQNVTIIGAGIIGVGIAVELVWRGANVILIDPREPGTAASNGNTGWVVPALSAPIPAPGLPWQITRWMVRSDSPFRISTANLLSMAKWLHQFWLHCDLHAHTQGLLAQGRLNAASYRGFDRWRSEGLSFEWEQSGVTFVSENLQEIQHIADELGVLNAWGYESPESLDDSTLRSDFPMLSQRARFGYRAGREQFVRPESVIGSLLTELRDSATFVRSRVDRVERAGHIVNAVLTDGDVVETDAVVIATGAWTEQIGKSLGLELPVLAGKGYSITVEEPEVLLPEPIYLADAKIACTPFEGANRFAGMMELTGPDDSIDPVRLLTMKLTLDRYIPGWDRGQRRTAWTGLRPMTPDGLPIIGKVSMLENVYIATGHGMLGVTMAPITGEIIADLVTDGTSRHDLTAFRPDRFSGCGLNHA
jgi:D-amino-acid dehydrogenase